MKDHNVIWIGADNKVYRSHNGKPQCISLDVEATAFTPLARAQQLQAALEDIAKQKLISEGDIEFGYDEIIRQARKALTEFERTE